MPIKKKRSLDIFNLLSRISKKDQNYYDKLEDHELKEFQPFVVMRWLTGTSDARQIYFINELLNKFVFDLGSHKQLLYQLMCVASSGQSQRYQWKKPASRKGAALSLSMQVVKRYFNYSTQKASDVIGLLSNDDILSYAEQLGYQKEELTKLKAELRKRNV